MDANARLQRYKSVIDTHLEKFFTQRIKEVSSVDPYASHMITLLKDFTMRGGKRIRACLMYHGYRLFSDESLDEAIRASMAFELIQSYLLIHDDIIDKDFLRRGGPAMHRLYHHHHEQTFGEDGAEHFGTSMGILAGNIANHLATLLLLNLDMPLENKTKAAAELNRVAHKVIYGEALDILSESKKEVLEDDIMKIHQLKTSSYTFAGPLLVGAILAGAPSKKLKAISCYAKPLGQAFQIQDDILGLFGDEKKLGKPVGSDLREGKRTLLIIKALESATPAQRKTILSALGNPTLKEHHIEDVRKIIISTGSLDYSKGLARSLIQEARQALEKLDGDIDAISFLDGIAGYMLQRES